MDSSDMRERKPERDNEHSPLACPGSLIEPEWRACKPYKKPIAELARSAEKKNRPATANDDCNLRQEAHKSPPELVANWSQN